MDDIKTKYELFDHQVEGVEFARKNKKCILAHEMGLGKSRMATVASGMDSKGTILVICPASLKINWEREIHMVYPDDSVFVVNSGPEIDIENHAWVIINYDMLEKYEEQILEMIDDGDIETVILDEAHYIKGSDTIRAKLALKVCLKAERVYLLTGTPIMNRPVEFYNLLKAIEHPLGKVKSVFVKRYCGGQLKCLVHDLAQNRKFFVMPQSAFPFRWNKAKYKVYTFVDDKGATHLDELRDFTKESMLRREKKDVINLPEKIIGTQYYELTPDQRIEYDNAWDVYLEWVEKHPDSARDIENIKGTQQLIEVGKLKQVCSSAKVGRIIEDIENAIEQGEKVIVFSQYTMTLGLLAKQLTDKKIGYAVLTGKSSMDERQSAVDRFQKEDDCKVFLANIKAGGVGITLTAASIVMFADMDWSPEVHSQCLDRAHRIGQKSTVNGYFYVCVDTIEESIMRLLEEKKDIIRHIIK